MCLLYTYHVTYISGRSNILFIMLHALRSTLNIDGRCVKIPCLFCECCRTFQNRGTGVSLIGRMGARTSRRHAYIMTSQRVAVRRGGVICTQLGHRGTHTYMYMKKDRSVRENEWEDVRGGCDCNHTSKCLRNYLSIAVNEIVQLSQTWHRGLVGIKMRCHLLFMRRLYALGLLSKYLNLNFRLFRIWVCKYININYVSIRDVCEVHRYLAWWYSPYNVPQMFLCTLFSI